MTETRLSLKEHVLLGILIPALMWPVSTAMLQPIDYLHTRANLEKMATRNPDTAEEVARDLARAIPPTDIIDILGNFLNYGSRRAARRYLMDLE
jgi:hypothetical protein